MPAVQHTRRLLFAPQALHNHGSCLVEAPNGDLLCCWYRGSGERCADDVSVWGSRLRYGGRSWGEPQVWADTPGFPDTNPCMFVDPLQRLWLLRTTVLDNRWESAIVKYRRSSDFLQPHRSPRWLDGDILQVKPASSFKAAMTERLPLAWAAYRSGATIKRQAEIDHYIEERIAAAGERLRQRIGWQTRAHPLVLPDRRILVPLYSDGFDISLVTWSDDLGRSWNASDPIVAAGAVQPTLARRRDGAIIAFFRDNGPAPNRVWTSMSCDRGETWSQPVKTALPNPGSGVDVVVLHDNTWLLANNDTEDGRHRLTLHISYDEGATWPEAFCVEDSELGADGCTFAYPSLIQARCGIVHLTYTLHTPAGETIAHTSLHPQCLASHTFANILSL